MSFTERVMARVADEPTPSPGRVFARSLGHFAIRDALAALATAWRLAFEPSSPVATSARASAAAVFLSVVIVVGVGGAFVAGGALALLGPDGPGPQQQVPAASPADSPARSPAATVEPTLTPTPTPTPTLTPEPTPSPKRTPAPTPSVSDGEQQGRSDRDTRETPEPEERERDTKEKRETPEPKERERDDKEDDEDD